LTATLIVAATIAAPISAAAAPAGGVGVRLIPNSSSATERDRAYLIANPAPGNSVTRRVEISNTTGQQQTVALYPGAATIKGGAFIGATATAAHNELADWTTLDRSELTLAPGTTEQVGVRIHVPAAAADGERYGAIWAAVTAPSGPSSPVDVVNRAGVRMYVSVGTGTSRSDFTIRRLAPSRDSVHPHVTATIKNTGTQALDLTGRLQLRKGGISAGPYAATAPITVPPGRTGTIRIATTAALPRGRWDATLALTGNDRTRTATTTVTVPPPAAPAQMPHPIGAIALGVGLLAVIALLAVLVLSVRRRAPANPA
jgi:hypothetical protein